MNSIRPRDGDDRHTCVGEQDQEQEQDPAVGTHWSSLVSSFCCHVTRGWCGVGVMAWGWDNGSYRGDRGAMVPQGRFGFSGGGGVMTWVGVMAQLGWGDGLTKA